jgi:hypothetical protein
MHTKLVTFATVVCLMGMMASADATSKRGAANSTERAQWCLDRLQACFDNSAKFCSENVQLNFDACVFAYNASCETSWGSKSTCKTDPLISQPGFSGALPRNQLPTTVAPSQPVPNTSPFQKAPNPNLKIAPRSVEGEPATSAPTGQEDKASAPK